MRFRIFIAARRILSWEIWGVFFFFCRLDTKILKKNCPEEATLVALGGKNAASFKVKSCERCSWTAASGFTYSELSIQVFLTKKRKVPRAKKKKKKKSCSKTQTSSLIFQVGKNELLIHTRMVALLVAATQLKINHTRVTFTLKKWVG